MVPWIKARKTTQKRSSTRQTSSTPHSLSGPKQSLLAATVKMWLAALWLHQVLFEYPGIRMRPWVKHSGASLSSRFLAKISDFDWSTSIPDLPFIPHIIRFRQCTSELLNYWNIIFPNLCFFTQCASKKDSVCVSTIGSTSKAVCKIWKCILNHTNAYKGSYMKQHDSRQLWTIVNHPNWFARDCEVVEPWHCGAFKWL